MQDLIETALHTAVHSYLEDREGYDFVSEVLEIRSSDPYSVGVVYRDTWGGYSEVTLHVTPSELLRRL